MNVCDPILGRYCAVVCNILRILFFGLPAAAAVVVVVVVVDPLIAAPTNCCCIVK